MPQKIVTIAPSITPILFELGVGDKVIGVTQYDKYPYNFSAVVRSRKHDQHRRLLNTKPETVTSLQPDLIFTTNVNDEIIPNLREQGYKVIVLGPKSIQGIYNDISIVGTTTGASAKATETVNNLRSQISAVQQKIAAANIAEKPTVYYEVYASESGLMTAGNGTWISDVISTAGGINLFADQTASFPYTSSEVVVSRNPSVILLPTNMGTGTPSYGSVADVKARAGWSTINAIQNNRLYVIDQDIMSEPGVRIAEQVQAVAACLYPQLFNSSS